MKAGAAWRWSADRSTLGLQRSDARTHAVTTLASIHTSGVEQVKFWNGSALKAAGQLSATA